MARPKVSYGGGWPAVLYSLRKGREAGGLIPLAKKLFSRNTCKTCAFGMGGQSGGMVNEIGRFPEVCKKSVQAQAGDMAGTIDHEFFARNSLRALSHFSSARMEELGRLTFPIMAGPGDTHWRPVSWDDALDVAGTALSKSTPRETFFYASGRSSNEAAFLMQLVARAYGTANIHNCSYYCHQASGVGLSKVYGSGTASIQLEDLDRADLAVVIGANPASNHPRMLRFLVDMRRRGGKVVVINPLRELGLTRFKVPSDARSMVFGSTVSDEYLQPTVGSDIALLKALLKGVIERGGVETEYVRQFTNGFEVVAQDVTNASWNQLLAACGVDRAAVDRVVELLLRANSGIFMWAMGMTHHEHGVDNILALSNLALSRGWLGRPGCGLLPIRGHSNVQGVGSVGVAPAIKASFAQKLEELYDIKIAPAPGQDTYASMVAASEGRIRAAVLLGGNLWGSNPDQEWSARALRNIPTSVSITTKLNPGHLHGRGQTAIILPALARDEENQSTTQESMFSYVRLSEGGTPNVEGGMRSEVDIVASLAERILPTDRFDWTELRSHAHLRRVMAQVVPGYDRIGDMDNTGNEFHIEGRTFHEPKFATADGRASFHVTPVPATQPDADELRMMTIRSEGQFNTVVYDEEDLYRGNTRRDVFMMSAIDATRLKLAEGDRVRVSSSVGHMNATVALVDISRGSCAMYYPEANVLVPRKLDPQSKTPAFKNVLVTVSPYPSSAGVPSPSSNSANAIIETP